MPTTGELKWQRAKCVYVYVCVKEVERNRKRQLERIESVFGNLGQIVFWVSSTWELIRKKGKGRS